MELCSRIFQSEKKEKILFMEQNYYFKHDASSFLNVKLDALLRKEGAKGYGIYWILLEQLRLQNDFRLPFDAVSLVARHARTQPKVVVRIIQNYGLFTCEKGMFFSAGLLKRMEPFLSKRENSTQRTKPRIEDKELIISSESAYNARKEEQRREEENNSLKRERVRGVLSMDEAIALLPSEQVWREDMARLSGKGVEFAEKLPELLPSFAAFLRLRGEEHTVTGLSDAKRRFMYWMKSDDGQQALKQLHARTDAGDENDPYRYETLVEGKRTYLGRPIPEGAPPRPSAWVVWNDKDGAWGR